MSFYKIIIGKDIAPQNKNTSHIKFNHKEIKFHKRRRKASFCFISNTMNQIKKILPIYLFIYLFIDFIYLFLFIYLFILIYLFIYFNLFIYLFYFNLFYLFILIYLFGKNFLIEFNEFAIGQCITFQYKMTK